MGKDRLPWFKCYPTLLIGALTGMPPDVGYVYTFVLLRTYEVEGACPDTAAVLSRRTGLSLKRVDHAVEWLLDQGKLTRSGTGLVNPFAAKILSERNQATQSAVSSGKIGGEKSSAKRQAKSIGAAKPPLKSNEGSAKPGATDLDLDRDSEVKKDSPRLREDDYPTDAFDRFWMLYPPGRKGAKKATAAKFDGIRRRGEVTFERMMAGLQRFVDSRPDPQYTKAPEVWLNKGCWEDEYIQRGGSNGKTQGTDDLRRTGFAGLAARARFGDPADRPAPEDLEPVNRR